MALLVLMILLVYWFNSSISFPGANGSLIPMVLLVLMVSLVLIVLLVLLVLMVLMDGFQYSLQVNYLDFTLFNINAMLL